jgi:hypothetical protein
MKKYKIYSPNKKYDKDDNILFVNFYTNNDIEILKNYNKKTVLYDSKELFLNNLDKIHKILNKKIDVISFDSEVQMIINKIRNKKKETLGILINKYSSLDIDNQSDQYVLAAKKNIKYIDELEKVYNIDFSQDINYFLKKDIPLCIIDIQNTPEYNKLLETRFTENNQKTYIIHPECKDILYKLFINNYWDKNINFIKIYHNCIFSNTVDICIKNAICKKYGLNQVDFKNNDPLIYFGDCQNKDYEQLIKHKNIIFIIWMNIESNDENVNIKTKMKYLKKKNIFHFSVTTFLIKILKYYDIISYLFPIDIIDTAIFKKVEKKGNKILVYKSKNLHQELIKQLPEYDFIFSNKVNLYDPIIAQEVYQKCFIAIRLTDFEGYVPMVDELNAMNIPIVHNFSEYGLKWTTIDDVKKHILINSPPIIRYNHQYAFDLFNNKIIESDLEMIYNNLNEWRLLIKKYNNILFISNDNDEIITNFIKDDESDNLNIYSIFLSGDKKSHDFENKIKKIGFCPNLVIVKGDCNIDIKSYYKVPIIFLVSELFLNDLNIYYWDKNSDKYINSNVINNIKTYDVSFAPSAHINDIIKKYNISCKLFYWAFIPYYRKPIQKTNNREYDYGIIKNTNINSEILESIKGKNVIIEEYSNLKKYLKDIKYILHNSYYDSSCQIKVDAIMNGCIYNISHYIYLHKQEKLIFKKGLYYILQFDGCIITEKLDYGINFTEGTHDKEIIIYYYAENDFVINELEFIKMQKINYNIVGYNPNYLKSIDVEYLYYLYGYLDIDCIKLLDYLGVLNIFNYYSIIPNLCKYNVELLKRKWCYDLGKKGVKLDLNDFSNFVLKNTENIIIKKCLLISKKIKGHGGNQKTALQIVQLLEKYFIVEVISNNINQKEYHFIADSLDYRIHNMKIIKKKKENEIIQYIHQNNYEFIINNKFNDYIKIIDKIIHPRLYVITHNSMDPFNELIIQNQNYINKVLTINKFHKTVLQHHGLKIPVGIFYNTVDEEINEPKRLKFKNRLCFIGRLTKEKNLKLLIDCMKLLDNLELVVIGGENEIGEENKNIIWKGILQKDDIIRELRQCDYLVVPSSTEGLPFVILEAMNIGIPCIYSNIHGANELIGNQGERGFTFELQGYEICKMRMDWSVFEEVDKYYKENINNIKNSIQYAYNITITEWNKMSKNCNKFIKNTYLYHKTSKKNIETFKIIL